MEAMDGAQRRDDLNSNDGIADDCGEIDKS
jgi:hypothetical protein